MAYQVHDFQSKSKLYASQLNEMDEQIEASASQIDALTAGSLFQGVSGTNSTFYTFAFPFYEGQRYAISNDNTVSATAITGIYTFTSSPSNNVMYNPTTNRIEKGQMFVFTATRDDTKLYMYVSVNASTPLNFTVRKLDASASLYPDLSKMTWNAVGDSITEQHLYMDKVKKVLNIPYNNKGISGTTLAINSGAAQYGASIVERVCGLNGQTAIADADIWTVMGGLNDCMADTPLGQLVPHGSAFDNSTVYGALQSIIENILSRRGNQHLLLMTPTQSARDTWTETMHPTTMEKIRQAVIDVARYYAVPCADVGHECGISVYNSQRAVNPTTRDGVHPTELGADMLGAYVARKMQDALYGWY